MANEIFIVYYDALDVLVRMFPGKVEEFLALPDDDDNAFDANNPALVRLWNVTVDACRSPNGRLTPTRLRSGELTKTLHGYASALDVLGLDSSLQWRYYRAVARLRRRAKQ